MQASGFPDAIARRPLSAAVAGVAIVGLVATVFVKSWPGLVSYFPGHSPVFTFLSYILVSSDPLSTLFTAYWGYVVTADIQGRKGAAFATYFWSFSVLAFPVLDFLAWLAGNAGHANIGIPLVGMWLPLAAVTIFWCALQPEAVINLFGFIPIKAKWIAAFDFLSVLVVTGLQSAPLGVLFSVLVAVCWFAGRGRIVLPSPQMRQEKKVQQAAKREFDTYLDDVRRKEMQREEKERLRRLFEASNISDPDEKD